MCFCHLWSLFTIVTVWLSVSPPPRPLLLHQHHPPPLLSCGSSEETSWGGGGAAYEDVLRASRPSISLSSRVQGPSDVTEMAEADWLSGEMGAWLSSDAMASTTRPCSFGLLWTGSRARTNQSGCLALPAVPDWTSGHTNTHNQSNFIRICVSFVYTNKDKSKSKKQVTVAHDWWWNLVSYTQTE